MPIKVWSGGKDLHPTEIPLTTKGDILVTDGTKINRFAAGSDGSVLTFDSTQTYGVKASTGTSLGALVLISTQTVSAVAQVEFKNMTSTYTKYIIEIEAMVPASTDTLEMQTSTNNGSSYLSSAASYQWSNTRGATTNASQSATSMRLAGSGAVIGSDALEGVGGIIEIINPTNSSTRTKYYGRLGEHGSGATHAIATNMCTGGRLAAEANDAVKLFFAGSNITSGIFRFYGVTG
jgi:hypothetical protein